MNLAELPRWVVRQNLSRHYEGRATMSAGFCDGIMKLDPVKLALKPREPLDV
jgi:hypothetical protein